MVLGDPHAARRHTTTDSLSRGLFRLARNWPNRLDYEPDGKSANVVDTPEGAKEKPRSNRGPDTEAETQNGSGKVGDNEGKARRGR